MGQYIINGGRKLSGEVFINGSKNAALPMLSAALINSGENIIHNCPDITDVSLTLEILKDLGCEISREGKTVIVNSKNAEYCGICQDTAGKMRSSILFMGVMLGKWGRSEICRPGGCSIGRRPIDIHLDAMKELGAKIEENDDSICCTAETLTGTSIYLPVASVGATENIMLAAVFAKGRTVIHNAAREPEVVALQDYLKSIGVQVKGAGGQVIFIEGCSKFNDGEYSVIPDRIEAGTFMAAAAMTKGKIFLKNTNWLHMCKTVEIFSNCGCEIKAEKGGIYFKSPRKIKPASVIRTGVYPNFPTDMQPIVMSMLTIAKGTSIIIETMFENRFNHVSELNKMGVKITAQYRVAIVEGVRKLNGASVSATDLRAGAALIAAALGAKGETVVQNSHFVERGYENIDGSLAALGADIKFSPEINV